MHHIVLPSNLKAMHCVEFAEALASELTRLGQPADVQYCPTLTGAPFLAAGDICWVLLPMATRSFERCEGVKYVLEQGERIPSENNTSPSSQSNLKRIRKVLPLYDWYFESRPSRLEYMRARGYRVAGYLPVGYHPLFDRRKDFEKLFPEPEWDVVFVGTVSPRRYACLQQLAKRFRVCPRA
ncbi:unnamed protein product, partial [marine sediment metagenome]